MTPMRRVPLMSIAAICAIALAQSPLGDAVPEKVEPEPERRPPPKAPPIIPAERVAPTPSATNAPVEIPILFESRQVRRARARAFAKERARRR